MHVKFPLVFFACAVETTPVLHAQCVWLDIPGIFKDTFRSSSPKGAL